MHEAPEMSEARRLIEMAWMWKSCTSAEQGRMDEGKRREERITAKKAIAPEDTKKATSESTDTIQDEKATIP